MLGLAKSEREALRMVIQTQREEINWLRSCIPWAVPAAAVSPPPSAPQGDVYAAELKTLLGVGVTHAMSEEEEDLQHLLDIGEIDLQEMKELLEAAGARSSEIEVIPGD